MKNNLFISDLDGTLLNDEANLSRFSRDILNKLIKKDLQFTVASARSVISMQKILEGLDIELPIIEFNGAFISDLRTGKHIIINEINPEIKFDIFELIKKYGLVPFISSFNGKKDILYYKNIQNEGCRWYVNDRIESKDSRLTKINKLYDTLKEHTICFTIIGTKGKLKELNTELEKTYGSQIELHLIENDYSPGWYWLTVHDAKATKDEAIKELVEITGHKLDDLIVFGDNVNDKKMFNLASKAIAVDNAKDILKRNADEIIGNNNSDSVVKYIHKMF
ncbi:MAG: HAD-IIB family hydrolase [Bacillota bacterium]